MVERAADRAGGAVDQGGRELGAHAVDARHAQLGRFGEELGHLELRVDVRLLLAALLDPGAGQGARVVGGPAVAVGFGLGGGEPLAGLGRLVAFAAQLGTLPLPVGELAGGGVDLGGQRRRGDAGGRGGLVLVGRLPGHRPQRLEPAELRDVLLRDGPQPGRGGARSSASGAPGLLLGGAGADERDAGPFGLGERVSDVGGADRGGELGPAVAEAGFGRGQVVPGPEGLGAAPLPVGEVPGLALPAERPVEVLAAGGDLALAGFCFRGRGPGEPCGPLRRRHRGRRRHRTRRRHRFAARRVAARRVVARQRDAGGLGDPGEQPGEPELGLLDLVRGGLAAAGEPLLHRVEPVGAEQPLQQLGPVAGVGVQEPRELALRQQHDLEELVGGHPHQVGDLGVRLPYPGGDGVPGSAGELLEQHLRLLGRGAGPAKLGAFLLRLAGDPHPPAAERRLELDLGRRARRGVIRAQPPGLAALAGHPAVQGEPDGVKQRGLARPGLAVQQEQPGEGQVVEADLHGAAERAERGHAQPVRAHQPAASSVRTAANALESSRSSPAVGGAWLTCLTNSAATDRSSRPAVLAR